VGALTGVRRKSSGSSNFIWCIIGQALPVSCHDLKPSGAVYKSLIVNYRQIGQHRIAVQYNMIANTARFTLHSMRYKALNRLSRNSVQVANSRNATTTICMRRGWRMDV
jgi:hypothetical protein